MIKLLKRLICRLRRSLYDDGAKAVKIDLPGFEPGSLNRIEMPYPQAFGGENWINVEFVTDVHTFSTLFDPEFKPVFKKGERAYLCRYWKKGKYAFVMKADGSGVTEIVDVESFRIVGYGKIEAM